MMIPSLMLTKEQIPTPALLVDLDALEANLARMAAQVKLSGKACGPTRRRTSRGVCPAPARVLRGGQSSPVVRRRGTESRSQAELKPLLAAVVVGLILL